MCQNITSCQSAEGIGGMQKRNLCNPCTSSDLLLPTKFPYLWSRPLWRRQQRIGLLAVLVVDRLKSHFSLIKQNANAGFLEVDDAEMLEGASHFAVSATRASLRVENQNRCWVMDFCNFLPPAIKAGFERMRFNTLPFGVRTGWV